MDTDETDWEGADEAQVRRRRRQRARRRVERYRRRYLGVDSTCTDTDGCCASREYGVTQPATEASHTTQCCPDDDDDSVGGGGHRQLPSSPAVES